GAGTCQPRCPPPGRSGETWRPGYWRITTTADCAWLTTCLLVEPSAFLRKPPPPCEPTTKRSASADAFTSSCTATPVTARTVTDFGAGSPTWLSAFCTSSSAACRTSSVSGASVGYVSGSPVQ